MHLLAAALYLALSAYLWKTRWHVPQTARAGTRAVGVEQALLLAAILVHGVVLHGDIFNAEGMSDTSAVGSDMRFGFAIALSFMLWLAMVLYWIESFYARAEGLLAIGLPAAAVAAVLPALIPEHHVLINAGSAGFRLHFLAAMLAYSLFTLAALHALLMSAMEKNLHKGKLSPLLSGLPPLLTMEKLLFRVIHVAFALLTLTLISGILFSEQLFGRPLTFSHKTVFAIVSWLIFAGLLLGRHLRGWRGRTALLWTQAGFVALLLAYVGTRFVLEVILGRPG